MRRKYRQRGEEKLPAAPTFHREFLEKTLEASKAGLDGAWRPTWPGGRSIGLDEL